MKSGLAACILLAASLGCRGASFPSNPDPGCELSPDRRVDGTALRCVVTPNARVLGVATAPGGQVALLGTYSGVLAFDPPQGLSDPNGVFLATLGPDLSTRAMARVDAPGHVMGWHVAAGGIALVSSSADAPEGPFLTRYDGFGRVMMRRDLGYGGLTTSVLGDGSGQAILRHKSDGVRLVVVGADGNVLRASQRLIPAWVHEFPSRIEENGMVQDMARLTDGSVITVHARAISGEVNEQGEVLSKVSAQGEIAWQRPVRLGKGAQLAALGDSVIALAPYPIGVCHGSDPQRSFGLVRLDAAGRTMWGKCYRARAAGLRLASDGQSRLVVSGQFSGYANLGDRERDLDSALRSFVMWVDDQGHTLDSVALGDSAGFVAIQSTAMAPDGRVLIAGALGIGGPGESPELKQTHLFIASVRP